MPSLSPVSLVRMSRLVAPVIKRLPSAFGQADDGDDADVDGKEHGVPGLSIHLDTRVIRVVVEARYYISFQHLQYSLQTITFIRVSGVP